MSSLWVKTFTNNLSVSKIKSICVEPDLITILHYSYGAFLHRDNGPNEINCALGLSVVFRYNMPQKLNNQM